MKDLWYTLQLYEVVRYRVDDPEVVVRLFDAIQNRDNETFARALAEAVEVLRKVEDEEEESEKLENAILSGLSRLPEALFDYGDPPSLRTAWRALCGMGSADLPSIGDRIHDFAQEARARIDELQDKVEELEERLMEDER